MNPPPPLPLPVAFKQRTNLWIVYMLYAGEWVGYVGFCRFTEFAFLADAEWQPEVKRFMNHDEFVEKGSVAILEIIHCETMEQPFNACQRHSLQYKPSYKWVKRPVRGKGRELNRVFCIETGEVFESAAEACRECNIAQSNMSLMLRGGNGVKTLKGLTFRYAEENE